MLVLKWAEENPDCLKLDTVLYEDKDKDDYNQEKRKDEEWKDTSENSDEETVRSQGRYWKILYQHTKRMVGSISFRGEELGRYQEIDGAMLGFFPKDPQRESDIGQS